MRRLVLLVAVAAGCGGGEDQTLPYAKLSDYGFFEGNGSTQKPLAGVIPYQVASSLFADFADKHRFLVLPDGGKISFSADGNWGFPAGAMLVKSFGYGTKLVETRILIKQPTGWLPTTYLWDDAQRDATLLLVGARAPIVAHDGAGGEHAIEYRVPNQNQCYGCHGPIGKTDLLGLRTRQMNRDNDFGAGPENQIEHLAKLGLFDGTLPAKESRAQLPDPYGTGPVEGRARAWLEANCAHCHNPDGAAGSTNLFLNVDVTRPLDLGVCRLPNAAGAGTGGRRFDIVPGKPEESIMTFRIASTDPNIKMPEMPIQLVDQAGVDLVTTWIASLQGSCGTQ